MSKPPNATTEDVTEAPRPPRRFLFRRRRPELPTSDMPLRSELFSTEQLRAHAKTLGGWHRIAPRAGPDLLLSRLDENEEIFEEAYARVTEALARGRRISPASEWLLDNYYLIQEQIHTARMHLPRDYSRELPQLASGPGEGLPRVYHMALELIAHLDGRVDAESVASFIVAYQQTASLRIGELWAVPIMLRLALLESIRRVAERITLGRKEFDLADLWADRLIDAAENNPAHLIVVVADMAKSNVSLTHGFVAEISRRLQGKNPALVMPLSWIEQRLSEHSQTLQECIQLETQSQAANQVSIGNCIGSIRVLAAIDWRDFVESLSGIEQILRRDPAHVYSAMDFVTRDQYRHAVENLAKYSGHSEQEVADKAIELAATHTVSNGGRRKQHVGFYLVDKGARELETKLHARLPLKARITRLMQALPLPAYFVMVIVLGVLITAAVAALRTPGPFTWRDAVLVAAILLCASQLAIAIANTLISWTLAAHRLPRLDFSKGIPASCRTMIVVPTMLSSDEAVGHLLEDLEVRYLANRDRHLHFALITDFPDATEEITPVDRQRQQAAADGIRQLNEKYQQERNDIFFLFHRPRRWNPREAKWMGYERKRGKLLEFNAMLRGGPSDPFSEIVGQKSVLPSIHYVITLDTDTELPRNSARELAATMAHPLVQPEVDARTGQVCEGYGILQPRVSVSLPGSNRSWFVKLFAGEPGLDPYTRVVSDTYQDLFREGSFIGKGIYDVDAFQKTLASRFPENRILSHDLIEGCHARAGLVSDIQLYEDYPAHFTADARRRHRWIRGDWQIAPWLLPRVPGSDARRINNPLSGLSRWKILDNLRRSLVPAGLLLLFLLAWAGTLHGGFGTLAALGVVLAPTLLEALVALLRKPRDLNWLQNARIMLPGIVRKLLQVCFTIAFLPFDAVVSMDAIIRTLWRMHVSRRGLLEWETASESQRRASGSIAGFFGAMAGVPLLALLVAAVFAVLRPAALPMAAPFLVAWFISPLIAWWLSRPLLTPLPQLTLAQQELLRRTSRRTWRFFEEFLSAEDNFLPPDNYQEYPVAVTAHRTSPTNIGCALLANLAANDFGYVSVSTVIARTDQTLSTLEKMERYHGHFYNWYDTRTLQPLAPLYISSVDSGNLMAMLLTFRQGLIELREAPLLPPRTFAGLADLLLVLKDACTRPKGSKPWHAQAIASRIDATLQVLAYAPQTLSACQLLLARMLQDVAMIQQGLGENCGEDLRWAIAAFERQARSIHDDLVAMAPWILLPHVPELRWQEGDPEQAAILSQARQTLRTLENGVSLTRMAELCRHLSLRLDDLIGVAGAGGAADGKSAPREDRQWLTSLQQALMNGADEADLRLTQLDTLAERTLPLSQMELDFLYDKDRDQLSIGFNVSERRRDPSFYDLLASEARLGSFVAVALEQLPQEHWFALGRRLTSAGGRAALLSWSGSMFEYLMPLLVMPTYEDTLLDRTYHAVIRRQIEYGRQRHVPWGISESGYNATDAQMNYQYRAFGVPGLGYKRGLSNDLVIAPYATVMALMVSAEHSAANLQKLEEDGFTGAYGFYEAVDYTASRLPRGQTYAIIRSFMAHHQGMSFLSLAYTMLDRPMQRRFMADPQLKATALLLHEQVPKTGPVFPQSAESEEPPRPEGAAAAPVRAFNTPDTPVPEVHLLSNGRYHVMISNAGSGWSRWNDLALTRWRMDPTRDCWGSYCYIRDLDSGEYWSAAYQPTLKKPQRYEAHFPQGRAEFRRSDADIDTRMDVAVSPEADVELRRIVLTNRSRRRRRLEITSYAEVVLAPPAAEAAHPAFGNLFVQTEILNSHGAIFCTRRPRSAGERPPVLLHLMTVQGQTQGDPTYETDRARFIGRGKSPQAPAALESGSALSGTAGAVLDPIVAIRRVIVLEEDQSASIDFITGIAENRDAAVVMADKYRDPRLGDRVLEMAWTHSQVVLRNLNATDAEAQVFDRLASSIVHPNRLRRADPALLARNRRGQSALWSYGVSGDLPIVLLRIGDSSNMAIVRQMVQAHAYWRMKGLTVDLVIWNQDQSGYRHTLNDQIVGLVAAGPAAHFLDRPGGIFIRRMDQFSEEDRVLFQTVAHAIIADDAGTLAEQVSRRPRPATAIPRLHPTARRSLEPGPKSTSRPLEFFNGMGGLTPDGKEYIITVDVLRPTPAPWCNVIANAHIGTVISEAGSAYTFAENAHEFRLTPWSNDPVSDTYGEAFYLRDEESGEVWSPCPGPARGHRSYVARHGFGYSVFECTHRGIRSELWIYVAFDAPVKYAVLKIENQSGRARALSATGYWEWVLSDLRSRSMMHVVTEVDSRTGALLARNAFNGDFNDRIAFVDVAEPYRTFTGDREQFLGRNGTLATPAALQNTHLAGKMGAGLDPCAAVQVPVELAEGQQRDVVFVLGVGRGIDETRDLIGRYRDGQTARNELQRTWDHWNHTLGAVHIETPDKAVNLLANGWLVYQTLECRMLARSGFYQSGGAYGFRDQLQDGMALLHAAPLMLREHLLRCAARQFREGDVQHWWHPPLGRGVRTKFSDDFLWLPLAVARYVMGTGDTGVLTERIHFLDGRPVKPEEESYYDMPHVSDETATLYEHCVRAIEHGLRYGQHGLPLMGCGDWNDGMNLVGEHGKGESVWLAFFLHDVLREFSALAKMQNDTALVERCAAESQKIRAAIEASAWDGQWYLRAFFDDGQPLGSASNPECQIDALPQSWAIISGAGDPQRAAQGMAAVNDRLVDRKKGIIQLFTPPFDKSSMNPGYIKGYVPGVRENGGQYTHAAIWTVMAFAMMGQHERAWELLALINPLNHGDTPKNIATYKVEPYVVAADVYAVEPHVGRGGWTWYTGSAGWMYRLIVETLLGLQLKIDRLVLTPRIPAAWESFTLHYRFRNTPYHITVARAKDSPARAIVDGVEHAGNEFPLVDDGGEHHVDFRF